MSAATALRQVLARIHTVADELRLAATPTLVAVSKLKPAELIRECLDAGHVDFGENYVDEMVEKASKLPTSIRWHFIGHLQSNKASTLVKGVPSLHCVHSVDSEKLARKLDAACMAEKRAPLHVMLQVNTSDEDSKSGVSAQECITLARFVHDKCKHLQLAGVMTIGKPGNSESDFASLVRTRDAVAESLGVQRTDLGLSMGMSDDYELAIRMGSTHVRVGSSIFGARPPHPSGGAHGASAAAASAPQ